LNEEAEMSRIQSSARQPVPGGNHQAGLGLLQVMLLLVLLSALVASAFQILQSTRDGDHALGQEETLAWADNAVAAFASAHSRLPCPARTVDGEEDCAIGSKGYLPMRTLTTASGLESSIIAASGPGQLSGPILYAVNRGADPGTDLAVAEQRYVPVDNDGDPRGTFTRKDGSEFAYDAVNGLDFCHALVTAAQAPAAATTAHTLDRAGGTLNIAYGVAIAGATAGTSGRFDRDNQNNAVAFDPPGTATASDYDDRVRVRSFQALAEASGCRVLSSTATAPSAPFPVASQPDMVPLAAVDLVGESVNISDTVSDLQESTLGSAEDSVQAGEMAVAFGAIGITMTGVKIGATTIDLVEKIGLLSQNIARCAASLGVECWRVPISIASLATVGAALGQAVAALGLQSGALADTKDALEKARKAKDMAKSETEKDPADLAAAIRQAYVTAWGDGNCDGNGEPVAPATTCEIGLQKRSQDLEVEAAAAEAELEAHIAHYIRPWEDANLPDRIIGYSSLTTAAKQSELDKAKNFRRLAQEAVEIQIQIEAEQAKLKEYDERIGQLEMMIDRSCTDPNTCYRLKVDELCAKTDAVSLLRCQRAREELIYVETCERNGIYHPGPISPDAGDSVPMCIPELNKGKPAIQARIESLEDLRDTRLAAVHASGMLNFASRTWVSEVRDSDGNVVTPGYYSYSFPSRLSYPSNWFCEGGSCDIPFTAYWTWWSSDAGGRLPLLRAGTFLDCSKNDFFTKMHCNQEWMSYGDAWREYMQLKDIAGKARDLADDAKGQYDAAVDNYDQLVDLASRLGRGEPVELWLGAHEILKGIDDRGALGSDRNGTAVSTVLP